MVKTPAREGFGGRTDVLQDYLGRSQGPKTHFPGALFIRNLSSVSGWWLVGGWLRGEV